MTKTFEVPFKPISCNLVLKSSFAFRERDFVALYQFEGIEPSAESARMYNFSYSEGFDSFFRYIPEFGSDTKIIKIGIDLPTGVKRFSIEIAAWRVEEGPELIDFWVEAVAPWDGPKFVTVIGEKHD